MRVGIVGAAGRMGRVLIQATTENEGLTLSLATEVKDSAFLGQDAGAVAGVGPLDVALRVLESAADLDCDVLIDFTRPEATVHHLRLCVAKGVRMVIGTTGLDPAQRAEIMQAGARIPIVWAPNMSTGVNLMLHLVALATKVLGETVDYEIIEAHHRNKVDAPSGTAIRLGEVIATGLGRELRDVAVYGRQGRIGARTRAEIGLATIRGGDIVGDHTVLCIGEGERLEISHRANSRMTFAHGAMRASLWLRMQPPGVYSMQDVLGLSSLVSQ